MKTYTQLLTLLLAITLLSCDKTDEAPDTSNSQTFDRQEMVSHLTTQYIIPAYRDYLTQVSAMETSIETFLNNPTATNLADARAAWKLSITAWQNIAFLEFGPAENIGLRSQTNIYPVDTNQINTNITSGNANLGIPTNFKAKGLQAIDYLLHLPNQSDADMVAFYSGLANRAEYLKAVVSDLKSNATTVSADWTGYSQNFINNTADNSQGSAVSTIVNSLSAHYETFVRKGKLGLPLGIFNGFSQTPMLGHAEALYSEYSLPLLRAQMESIQKFINGKSFESHTDGLGLADYMDFVDAKKGEAALSVALNNQINSIISGIDGLNNEPLNKAITNQNSSSKALYQEMQKLVPIIKVDLTSALGVLITYQDNDGD